MLALVAILATSGAAAWRHGRSSWFPLYLRAVGTRSVAAALAEHDPYAGRRLRDRFEAAGVAFPPDEIVLIGLKDERRLELWARTTAPWQLVHSYRVLAASGRPGPKLREGDQQVPEGVYRIVGLNPNSSFHLSMKLDYPNAFDRRRAAIDGRASPGGDIFIHGKDRSIGCVAVGDDAIEELFVLVATVGARRARVILAPRDLRRRPAPENHTPWVADLHADLRAELSSFIASPRPASPRR